MKDQTNQLSKKRVGSLLSAARNSRILVVGDLMLDQFVWGRVGRISPEAPVPVVEFERESFMPGGAANVARNLATLGVRTSILGVTGRDAEAARLRKLLQEQNVEAGGLVEDASRMTSVKSRIVAHRQQVVRVDRESRGELSSKTTERLLASVEAQIDQTSAIIVGDYGKGCVNQTLVEGLKTLARPRGIWLSFDPKPVHRLNLHALSLVTPNRKEAFELAGETEDLRGNAPASDPSLLRVADRLLQQLSPAVLLITLGEQGMLLCQRQHSPIHIPTRAREVFDVSGAGDTVIATFTLGIAAGASPLEAAILANHAAGVVVGKIGTAVVHPEELIETFS